VRGDSTYVSSTFVLEAGDTLVFYTDGLIEVGRDVIAGERRFADTLARYPDDVEAAVGETLGGEQHDDVALLALSLLDTRPVAAWHFESDDAGSATDARFAFVAYLQRRNLDPDLIATAELVFGELVANVVRHAPGPIEIDLGWRDNAPVLSVRDRGPHFEVGLPALPEDAFAESGRGLFIVANAASAPVVTARPTGGNEVAVVLAPASRPLAS
jgi:serine/threonine-protein kinase RsbW